MTFLYLDSEPAQEFARSLAAAFAPPPDVRPSEWAEGNIVLTSDFAAEPGNYSLTRTPWCRAPLDDAADPTVEQVVITGSSQMGKTQLSLAVAAYFAALRPCSIMHVVPTDSLSETFASRFDSMVRASPALKEKFVQPRRTRASANRHTKSFDGGVLVLASASSPSDLSSRPVKLAIADEIDRMGFLKREGDPLSLIEARQATYFDRKFYAISTPTLAGMSRVEAMYSECDRFEWEAACPHCDGLHVMSWDRVQWESGQPETAVYVMPCCGAALGDAERWRAAQAGSWIKIGSGKAGWRGYRFNGLCSPWMRLAELVAQFEAARGSHAKLQPFYNLKLGVAYENEAGEGADAEVVRKLAEPWREGEIPERRIVLLTAGVDVQLNWLACQIVGWSDGDEAWTLGWYEIEGDTLDPRTWAKLAEILSAPWRHPSGEMMHVEAAAIDSGFQSQSVYEFSAANRTKGRKWFACKGMSGGERPIWQRGGDINRSLSKIYLVGTEPAKAQVASSLITTLDGPGRWHTPQHIHERAPHFADWLCAEELVTKETPSGTKGEWRLRKGARRNEALDTAVYALAARYSSEFRLAQRVERMMTTGTIKAPSTSFADLAARMAAVTAVSATT